MNINKPQLQNIIKNPREKQSFSRNKLFIVFSTLIIMSASLSTCSYSSNSSILPQTIPEDNLVTQDPANSSKNQTTPSNPPTTTPTESPVLIQVPIIEQKPELYNGCEVTTLTMLLNWAGVTVDKLQLADKIQKDNTQVEEDEDGEITYWGDPNRGFVGDITGIDIGYGVYHKPIASLLNQFLPGKAADLTGSTFDQILDHVKQGKPVAIWCTSFFAPTDDWVTWQSANGTVKATFDEHCVLLVGFDRNKKIVYLNDPLDGAASKAVALEDLEKSWEQLGSQAVSVN